MKRLVLYIVAILLQTTIMAQQFSVSTVFMHSSYNKFENSLGYTLGYDRPIKLKNRLEFAFSQSFNYTDYTYVFISDADGKDYYREVEPSNQHLSFAIAYTSNLSKKAVSGFFIGPCMSLNYLKVNESIVERPVNETESYTYNSKYWEVNKIGLGLLFAYSHQVFSEKISIFCSTKPELLFFTRFGLKGSSDPPIIAMINFNLGMRMNMIKNK